MTLFPFVLYGLRDNQELSENLCQDVALVQDLDFITINFDVASAILAVDDYITNYLSKVDQYR